MLLSDFDKAKVHAVVGAMIVDNVFRGRLFGGDDAQKRGALRDYSRKTGMALEDSTIDFVVAEFFKSPCSSAIQTLLDQNQSAICPCWPCLQLTM